MMRGGDVRALKAQLDLTARSVLSTRIAVLLWSLLIALLCSVFGVFGHQSWSRRSIFPHS